MMAIGAEEFNGIASIEVAVKDPFKALILEQEGGRVRHSIRELRRSELPDGDVLVSIAYSSLNYKDGLAVTGQGKIISRYPMVPGIDLAGTVEESASAEFRPGDTVLLTGWGIGERHWGGYAQAARVNAAWLLPVPEGLTLQGAMGIGTAGLTAMLSVMAMEERGLTASDKQSHPDAPGRAPSQAHPPAPGVISPARPELAKTSSFPMGCASSREVIVTGAAGGVGGIAIAILSKLGYRVVASTGRTEAYDYLKALGASEVVDRKSLSATSGKALESERWAGAVDTVGGETLATLLRTMAHGGCVAVCGLAGGSLLQTTVFPFILRGVSVIGIASSTAPRERRRLAWARLVYDLPREALERMIQVASLSDVPALSHAILQGHIRGRVVIDPNQ
ncbi:MAG: MDR family oxidoreductase [Nitrospiraceae bacterium]